MFCLFEFPFHPFMLHDLRHQSSSLRLPRFLPRLPILHKEVAL
jgi:hypothetical protein